MKNFADESVRVSNPISVLAPGRVNLIGEHTDYSDGFCLPVAINRACHITATPTDDGQIRATSAQLAGEAIIDAGTGAALPGSARWGTFVAGAAATVRDLGHIVGGMQLTIDSSVPPGAGLSSSSALAVALTLVLLPPDAPERHDLRDIARLALAAEVRATGVPGGLLDQMASLGGREGHALLLDCRALTIDPVPIPDDLAILVIHSGVERALAESAYAARRASCEAAARRIGVDKLRDARLDQVDDDPFARHVVTENARVLEFCAVLRAPKDDRDRRLGDLLLASHASLRDDFEVSTPELDVLVEQAVAAGAIGARLTGAGFGGCIVALAPKATAAACLDVAMTAYRAQTGRDPTGFIAHATAGALVSREPTPTTPLKQSAAGADV